MSRAERERESRRLTVGNRLNTKLTTTARTPWDGSTVPTGASFHDIAAGERERLRVWVTEVDGRLTVHVNGPEQVLVEVSRW